MEMAKVYLDLPERALVRLKAMARLRKTTVSHLILQAVKRTYGIHTRLGRETNRN
ncbi:MAG: hypothetical protein HKL90_15820 [Elusimicrobia bacterium]|nr:hypothetical protein [Elusimicrobiota bacterium]